MWGRGVVRIGEGIGIVVGVCLQSRVVVGVVGSRLLELSGFRCKMVIGPTGGELVDHDHRSLCDVVVVRVCSSPDVVDGVVNLVVSDGEIVPCKPVVGFGQEIVVDVCLGPLVLMGVDGVFDFFLFYLV